MLPVAPLAGARIETRIRIFAAWDAHVRRLLASDSLEEVTDQLQRLFVRLEGKGIALDYNRLLWDLRKWSNHSEDVKTSWGKDYWMSQKELENAEGVAE